MLRFLKGSIHFDSPLVVIAVLLTVAIWWWRRPASRGAWRLLVAYLAIFYFVSTPVGSGLLLAGLGHGLTPIATREDAAGADAVVVLGGGVETVRASGVILSQLASTASLRILEGARVYKLIGARFVIVSGGIADDNRELRPEAEQMAAALVAVGVPADRILLDRRATNTHDHPQTIRPLLDVHQIRRFVIVTSPEHMRRALSVFRKAGFDPVPSVSPLRSDQLTTGPLFWPDDDALVLSNMALYDYAAYAYYWARGWLA